MKKSSIKAPSVVLFGDCPMMLKYLETEMKKSYKLLLIRQCSSKFELRELLRIRSVDVVVVGLSTPELEEYCISLREEYRWANFILISNDFERTPNALSLIREGIFEASYNASVEDLIFEINLVHRKGWLREYESKAIV